MASLCGVPHRPLSAMAAVVVTAVSSDFPDKLPGPNSADPLPPASVSATVQAPRVSVSTFLSKSRMPPRLFDPLPLSVASPSVLLTSYQYAKLAKPTKSQESTALNLPSSSDDAMYRWHLPAPDAMESDCSAKSGTVVVLLGWLGAKQRHLRKYAEWYTKRGFNVITFTFPMNDVISYKVGGKAEQNLDAFAEHLAEWVAEENEKKLVFHTFSNTGWLTYGVILEKFKRENPSLMEKIKGCIVDSAPVAAPDPQVWASGFSAALLRKHSVATKGGLSSNNAGVKMVTSTGSGLDPKPAIAETALLAVLEKFFNVVLNLPSINRRLSDVLHLLSSEQPKCPQLYIYSSADRVIPAASVETFIEKQRQSGHEVRACDFLSSPHVDHFRNHPTLYTSQLTTFLEDCVLKCCKGSS